MINRQVIAAILVIAFLVSIALAASASPLRAEPLSTPMAAPLNSSARHLIGTIDSLSQDQKSFTLNLKTGHKLTVRISDSTEFLQFNPNKKTLAFQDLKTDDRVGVASIKTTSDYIDARLVILLPDQSSSYRITRGSVSDLKANSFTLVSQGKTQQVSLTAYTIYSKKDHSLPTLVNISDLTSSSEVLIIGTIKDDTITAKLVHIIKS